MVCATLLEVGRKHVVVRGEGQDRQKIEFDFLVMCTGHTYPHFKAEQRTLEQRTQFLSGAAAAIAEATVECIFLYSNVPTAKAHILCILPPITTHPTSAHYHHGGRNNGRGSGGRDFGQTPKEEHHNRS
jgi:hypothetical protein